MRWILLAALFAALPRVGAAPVPQHLKKEESYWPTAVGTKWVFDQHGDEVTEEITDAEVRKGAIRIKVKGTLRGVYGPSACTYDIEPDRVVYKTCDSSTIDTILFKFNAKAGDSWQFPLPSEASRFAEKGTIKVIETKVIKVPAGEFLATKALITTTERNGQPLKEPLEGPIWFAKGVGVIQWGEKGDIVLKSFTSGK